MRRQKGTAILILGAVALLIGTAAVLATAREVVSRILEHFEDNGLVRLRRARVDVVDLRHLARVYAVHSSL